MSSQSDRRTPTKGQQKRKAKSGYPARASLGKQASTEAGQRAAAILEVLGGLRRPAEAAQVLKISVTHYYLLERKALAGLLAACEPQPKGRGSPGLERQLARLQRELESCQRECLRQAALVRATQRAVGLPAIPSRKVAAKADKQGPAKRRRRPTVRALRVADTLRKNSPGDHSAGELEQMPREQIMEGQARTVDKEPQDGT